MRATPSHPAPHVESWTVIQSTVQTAAVTVTVSMDPHDPVPGRVCVRAEYEDDAVHQDTLPQGTTGWAAEMPAATLEALAQALAEAVQLARRAQRVTLPPIEAA